MRTANGAAVAVGPSTGWHDAPLSPASAVLGLRLLPGAASGLLDVAGGELTDRVVDLDLLLRSAHLGDLEPRDWHARAAHVLGGRARHAPGDETVRRAVRRLGSSTSTPIPVLAAALSVSPRHLRRRFHAVLGLSPVQYARHRRLQRLLADASTRTATTWTTLAADHGCADQAHLSREVLALTGRAPNRLLPRRSHR